MVESRTKLAESNSATDMIFKGNGATNGATDAHKRAFTDNLNQNNRFYRGKYNLSPQFISNNMVFIDVESEVLSKVGHD